MTQTMFAPPPVLTAPEESTASGSSRRPLVLIGGLVAAHALGGGGYVLLSGGGSSDDLGSGPAILPKAARPVAKAPAKKPAAVKPAAKVPVTSTVPLGRDPFHALYLAPVVTTVAPPAAAAPTSSTPTTTTPTTTTPTTTTPTSTAPKTYKLVLTKVSGSGSSLTATFTVGGKMMVAKVGSVFGPTSEIKLLSLGQDAKGVWVAVLQVGDGEPVDAAKGATLYVR
jgi:hypothetical protein